MEKELEIQIIFLFPEIFRVAPLQMKPRLRSLALGPAFQRPSTLLTSQPPELLVLPAPAGRSDTAVQTHGDGCTLDRFMTYGRAELHVAQPEGTFLQCFFFLTCPLALQPFPLLPFTALARTHTHTEVLVRLQTPNHDQVGEETDL